MRISRKAIRWARRTEGKLTLLTATVAVLAIAAGTAGTLQVRDRSSILDDMRRYGGPLTIATAELHRSLSDVDAMSVSAFLAGNRETPELRERYQTDIALIGAALSATATGDPAGENKAIRTTLVNHLPTYTGLVETARANRRQGFPVGAAYLRESSTLLQDTMLPAAQRLFDSDSAQLAAAQSAASTVPWVALALALLLVVLLVAAQVYLRRRTRRLLNAWLLLATVLVLVGLAGLGIEAARSASYGAASRQDGTEQIEALARARIAANQARRAEALTLIVQGNRAGYERDFADAFNQLTKPDGLLDQAKALVDQPQTRLALDDATDAAHRWSSVHTTLRKIDDSGDYVQAISMMINNVEDSPGVLAARLDSSLGTAIAQATSRFEDATDQARNALAGKDIGFAVLCLAGAIATGMGMRRRIAEYR